MQERQWYFNQKKGQVQTNKFMTTSVKEIIKIEEACRKYIVHPWFHGFTKEGNNDSMVIKIYKEINRSHVIRYGMYAILIMT